MKTKSAVLILLASFLFLTSCEEKEKVWTELPPATQIGANTIGCLVDGQLWATGKIKSNIYAPSMSATYIILKDSAMLNFSASGKNGSMAFFIKNPKLGDNIATSIKGEFSFITDCPIFETDTIGIINISKLETNFSNQSIYSTGIISGNFSINLPCKKNPVNVINITDGRFDFLLDVTNANH